MRQVIPSDTKNAPKKKSLWASTSKPSTISDGLKQIVSMNMRLSHEFSLLKKEINRTKTEKIAIAKKLYEKISEHVKLDEEKSKLDIVELLEREKFTDNLIDLNITGKYFSQFCRLNIDDT